MSIRGAELFLKTAMKDPELRSRLNGCDSYSDCRIILAENGMDFTEEEYENAFNHLHTLCQFDDQAGRLKEIDGWWRVLRNILCVC